MKIVIGNEYDDELILKLKKVIIDMGGIIEKGLSGIAGSQELSTYSVLIEKNVIEVEIETYIGITVTGNDEIVKKIMEKINLTTAST